MKILFSFVNLSIHFPPELFSIKVLFIYHAHKAVATGSLLHHICRLLYATDKKCIATSGFCIATFRLLYATGKMCIAISGFCIATFRLLYATGKSCIATSGFCIATFRLLYAISKKCIATSGFCIATFRLLYATGKKCIATSGFCIATFRLLYATGKSCIAISLKHACLLQKHISFSGKVAGVFHFICVTHRKPPPSFLFPATLRKFKPAILFLRKGRQACLLSFGQAKERS